MYISSSNGEGHEAAPRTIPSSPSIVLGSKPSSPGSINSREKEQMDSNVRDESYGYEAEVKGNGLHLRPVSAGESGEGLPYAPIDWPNLGDNWTWNVGKRKSVGGFWRDRFLYTPISIQKTMRKKHRFTSIQSLEQYIRKEFPDKDVNALLSSFSWRIPAARDHRAKDDHITLGGLLPEENMSENSKSGSQPGSMDCKARNMMCNLQLPAGNYSLPAMDCNLCCSEPGFCRDCCCILCCKTIDWTYGGYSFIRCEAKVDENHTCGHLAHMNCALRSYMAGTVGGNIGLDVEYYCRRCDNRTDLISHVTRLIQICESFDAQEEIGKILSMGLCILHGSQRTSTKKLLNHMELVMAKLKRGSSLEEIWKEDDTSAVSTDDQITLGGLPPEENMAENSKSGSQPGSMDCKARNKMCNLQLPAGNYSLPTMDCNICCSEPGFCRDCCCILCCKTIDWTYGGYSFIRCEAKVDENHTCGHLAHMNCALRSYMAGTVGGNIGLDVEYYCRRCDNRTDLISHVTRLLQICGSLDAREEIEKILSMGLCILHGSQRTSTKKLLNHMELAMAKLKRGSSLEEIWKEDDTSAVSTGNVEVAADQDALDLRSGLDFTLGVNSIQKRSQQPTYITSDYRIASVKLEDEIDQVLQLLRKSQETEYKIAEERLYAQKSFLLSLSEQLNMERSGLAKDPSTGGESDALLANVLNRVNQINRESARLKEMEEVAKGFGRVTKAILIEHFGLEI